MEWNKKGILLINLLVIVFSFAGCVTQDAKLNYSPNTETLQEQSAPDGTKRPDVTPFYPSIDSVAGSSIPTDAIGITIIDPDSHYFRYYISFSDIRIYEEDEQCYLDGICTNGFEQPLKGQCRVLFFDNEGRTCGEGDLHTADSTFEMNLMQGDNRIFSEIAAEMDVSECALDIEIISPFYPYNY